MRRTSVALNALVAISLFTVPVGLADDHPDPKAAPVVQTQVSGEISADLRGVWLLVSHGTVQNIQGERIHNSLEIDAIRQQDGKLDVQPFLVLLPADMQQQLDDANDHLRSWSPSPEQIDRLSRSLESLTPMDPMRYYRHTTKIAGPAHYDEVFKPTVVPFVKDGVFAMEVEHIYRPQPADKGLQVINDDAVYRIEKVEPALIEGQHGRTVLAAGFVPIPVATVQPVLLTKTLE